MFSFWEKLGEHTQQLGIFLASGNQMLPTIREISPRTADFRAFTAHLFSKTKLMRRFLSGNDLLGQNEE